LLESVSFAFLLALEVLTPSQRAVLLLRDVFDYSTEEAAAALDLTEANVKVLLMRARRKMKEYDKTRAGSGSSTRAATRRVVEQFLRYLGARDAEGIERLLAEEVVSISDGGGEVVAARRVVRGRDNVLRLILGLAGKALIHPRFEIRLLNGLPAVVVEDEVTLKKIAHRYTIHFDVGGDGRIRGLHTVLAPSKLSGVKFEGLNGVA
jgi:RNA polymerase sigma-70 factor (ECF subfamily)